MIPACQRRGIARAMLAETERWAREKGCADLWLATEPGNTGAQSLYGRFAQPKPCVLFTGTCEPVPQPRSRATLGSLSRRSMRSASSKLSSARNFNLGANLRPSRGATSRWR